MCHAPNPDLLRARGLPPDPAAAHRHELARLRRAEARARRLRAWARLAAWLPGWLPGRIPPWWPDLPPAAGPAAVPPLVAASVAARPPVAPLTPRRAVPGGAAGRPPATRRAA